MLARRQPDLTVCMEQVHKPHNVSAIIRTADAVGVHEVHAVWPGSRMRTMASAAAGSNSWVQVKTHRTIGDAVAHLKGQGMQILATHLSDNAVDFREIDYTRPTCILMGQEKTGITQEALALADQDIIIPMIGMVQSLNVSVASALILYEAQRQRQNAGMYLRENSMLPEAEQQRLHLWLLSLLYLATFGSFIGFSAGFAMLAKTQFPDVNILRLAFFGPFIGAIARSVGGAISDKFGGVRVTLINFIFMAIFSALLFLTLPGTGSGNFIAFYAVFMGLFLTAGLGSGSTFQMIAVIFRQITIYRVKMKGGSDEQAQKEAVTETAAALGFISAIGAVGGFFIPQAFGMSLNMTGSPVGAMKVFLIFYIVCVLLTWLVYGRRKFSQK